MKGLSINEIKTVAMFIQPSRSSQNLASISLIGSPLNVVSTTRCLGVVIDDGLLFSSHMDSVVSKVGCKIGVLRRVRR